jgi:hypothetical protein
MMEMVRFYSILKYEVTLSDFDNVEYPKVISIKDEEINRETIEGRINYSEVSRESKE